MLSIIEDVWAGNPWCAIKLSNTSDDFKVRDEIIITNGHKIIKRGITVVMICKGLYCDDKKTEPSTLYLLGISPEDITSGLITKNMLILKGEKLCRQDQQ